ncbi:single-stranded DNA-binding protein [Arthrobacter sp. EpRS71]|uniref:single-stranded DNA-binding protein n=1 Tax=Arthrobacter sp. EpRS71 TaxID=1743141 RepID=UPI000746139F|nr:single-stranded DNA-binding protein [Arthrobacter sp. EpRS71]KUM34570.1 hypothetical protein AR689_10540 [Arthrobacter sp. EpRS71]
MADVTFTGNLGGEPVLDFKPSGNACLAFRVADTKGKKDAQGNWDKDKEQTQWFRCTLWGPDAEYYVERLRKGARVTVFGELMSREYVDNQGVNRTSLDVTVKGISIVNKRNTQTTEPLAAQSDPWATPPAQNTGGWPSSEPSF